MAPTEATPAEAPSATPPSATAPRRVYIVQSTLDGPAGITHTHYMGYSRSKAAQAHASHAALAKAHKARALAGGYASPRTRILTFDAETRTPLLDDTIDGAEATKTSEQRYTEATSHSTEPEATSHSTEHTFVTYTLITPEAEDAEAEAGQAANANRGSFTTEYIGNDQDEAEHQWMVAIAAARKAESAARLHGEAFPEVRTFVSNPESEELILEHRIAPFPKAEAKAKATI